MKLKKGNISTQALLDDTKRVIARYFGIRTNDYAIEDHDGDKAVEKWVIPD